MELFHTSPVEITRIHELGTFDEFLFFSGHVYTMAACEVITYKIDLEEDEVIEAGQLFYHPEAAKLDALVATFAARHSIDIDTAEEIISEREQLDSDDSEELWAVQLLTARAAKILGYRAVQVSDEQGAAWMVDMGGREADLVKA